MIAYFEDVLIGDELVLGSHTFTAEEIIDFAKKFDPQEFHLSEEGARETHFGRLCASGWHTAAIFMQLTVQKTKERAEAARQRGEPIAQLGPSPGFDDLKWRKPVYAGDTITYQRVVSGKTESRSRLQWGIIHANNYGVNQDGETVFSFTSNVFLERRPTSDA